MNFNTGKELLDLTQQVGNIYEVILEYEAYTHHIKKDDVVKQLEKSWSIMQASIKTGLEKNRTEKGFMIGGEALKMQDRLKEKDTLCSHSLIKAISYGLSVMEVNACMGKIVACPTAGSSGVMPAILLNLKESMDLTDEAIIKGLLVGSGIGIIIGKNATLSGAQGGCQAEVGSASAMAAAAAVEIMGGTPQMVLTASAIAIQNLLGLVCDPVAGLVEEPCQKRNAIGIANALISAEMALAGINNLIPFDEVVQAMREVADIMPMSLRETSEGGIAKTPTGKKYEEEIFSLNE
ncbi:L-serine dehydratase [Natranaerovirga hydrolytica]|uniref:L-serine dehydratase n=1 Tax=Natranaerovirga hydrolytica TaxID=680378 RepID=A0A4R1NA54_9FIRM|nr:L-serine ammonia-lyase, iron-sulfur-dependent, subunit alpha [Natranaerovirga hydrolytica]TCL00045.1 L-serine dehydratase [Natranaerovirga hydrolytica]